LVIKALYKKASIVPWKNVQQFFLRQKLSSYMGLHQRESYTLEIR